MNIGNYECAQYSLAAALSYCSLSDYNTPAPWGFATRWAPGWMDEVDLRRVEIVTSGPEETQNVGRALGAHAIPGHIFLLIGELGSGKTCLTQGVLWGLGGDEFARSPTFVLVAQYQGRLPLFHIDLYRLGAPDEVLGLGLDEYLFGGGLCVVEWADRAAGYLADGHLEVRFERIGETGRRLVLSSGDPGYGGVLDAAESSVAAARSG